MKIAQKMMINPCKQKDELRDKYKAAVQKVEDMFRDTTEPHQTTDEIVLSEAPSLITGEKDDLPKPGTQPIMNRRFYGGQGAKWEPRYMGRGVQEMRLGYMINDEEMKQVSQPTTKYIVVVHILEEMSTVCKPAESIARVVAMLRLPLSYARDSEDSRKTRGREDMKRGRFWQSQNSAWSLSSSHQVKIYEVAGWISVCKEYIDYEVAECISVAEQKSKKEYVDRLERMRKKKEM